MRYLRERDAERLATESPEYLRGYRDGIRDRRATSRPASGDGLLGALLAIALLAGLGYFGYNYATTGRFLPPGIDVNAPSLQMNSSQP